MTRPADITVRIGRLVLHGVSPAEANRLAADLRASIAEAMAGYPADTTPLSAESLSLAIPSGPAVGLGSATGRAVAAALAQGRTTKGVA